MNPILSPSKKQVDQKIPGIMYYRRRIMLSLLQQYADQYKKDSIEKIRLQKLLFLFTRQQEKPAYDFIPYKYGCYSFQANEDARILAEYYGLFTITKNSYLIGRANITEKRFPLKNEDSDRIDVLLKQYGNINQSKLLYEIYEKYPWYAINSKILDKPHFSQLRDRIVRARAKVSNTSSVLYTLGYEGISIERYMTKLMEKGVAMLVDVRHNPFSMKYGFSQKNLRYIAEECKIKYLHIPSLGIKGSDRRNLKSRADYSRLFAAYRGFLAGKETELSHIQNVLKKYKRVTLTCFEKDHTYCHRHSLAEVIQSRSSVTVEHL